ncbi:succinyl-diaminopimelate desuccinylase [Candidatus Vidania fulgoroideorum]
MESKSITPKDKKIQKIIGIYLKKIGFEIFSFKKNKVTNSIFLYLTKRNKIIDLVFSGHTDVVGINNLDNWKTNPFKFIIKKKKLFSRGVCDMKSAIFCFLKAVKFIIKKKIKKNFSILLTSNEEGDGKYGTKIIVNILKKKKIIINNCLIGEPSSNKVLFDTIKNGRRGSFNLKIFIKGKQGHSAYPNKAVNSLHILIKICNEFKRMKYKKCSIQITRINTKNKTINIIPGESVFYINIRYNKKINLYKIIFFIIKNINIKYKILFLSNSREFYKKSKNFSNKVLKILKKYNTIITKDQGGTSDGRFLKKISKNILEIGMVNYYAHKDNENIMLKDIFLLIIFYYKILYKI